MPSLSGDELHELSERQDPRLLRALDVVAPGGALREGIDIATRIDARDELVGNLSALGHTHLTAGDLVAAEAVLQQGLRLAREIGMRSGETQILLGLGSTRAKAGDMVAAPGCLSEIAWVSAIEASRLAVAAADKSPSRSRAAA